MVAVSNMLNKVFTGLLILLFADILSVSAYVTADTSQDEAEMVAVNYAEWETQRLQYLPKIVVVDMWAMWCTSCIEQFPDMIQLSNKFKGKKVEFVSMNLDDREDETSLKMANKFLNKMNANFDHFHMNENLMHVFEKFDLIGIPAVLIYDDKGNEQYRLTRDNPNNQFTKKDIEHAITNLINLH